MDFKEQIGDYFGSMSTLFDSIDYSTLNSAINLIKSTKGTDSKIYIFGNGGSASTAMHLTCDFNKGCGNCMHGHFDFICLNDNIPTIMAYANDCGYENVFIGQLNGKLKSQDILFCISGSGNSENVIKAAEYGRECGCKVISMTGFDGGKLKKISDCAIHVPIDDMQKVEDCHLIIGHMMAQILMG